MIISGIAFGGKPLKVLERTLSRNFLHVSGTNIFEEVRKNLISKLVLNKAMVDRFLNDLSDVSTVFVPKGETNYIENEPDNLVLEVALAGGCDVLVTGDRRHLLPLSPFQGMIIEPPSKFLARLDALKGL